MTQYYSKTKKELVNINDMHHQHVWYAFKKLCDRLEELHMTTVIWEDDYKPTNLKKLVGGYVRRDVYELLFNKCERLEKNANSKMVFKLEQEVSRLKRELKRTEENSKFFNPYLKSKAHRYVFSNIPNDDNGQSLVKTMRFYLNKDGYNMRVRGQYLDKSKLERGESWKTYDDGQPLSKSRCIRVYLDKKKERI